MAVWSLLLVLKSLSRSIQPKALSGQPFAVGTGLGIPMTSGLGAIGGGLSAGVLGTLGGGFGALGSGGVDPHAAVGDPDVGGAGDVAAPGAAGQVGRDRGGFDAGD